MKSRRWYISNILQVHAHNYPLKECHVLKTPTVGGIKIVYLGNGKMFTGRYPYIFIMAVTASFLSKVDPLTEDYRTTKMRKIA